MTRCESLVDHWNSNLETIQAEFKKSGLTHSAHSVLKVTAKREDWYDDYLEAKLFLISHEIGSAMGAYHDNKTVQLILKEINDKL